MSNKLEVGTEVVVLSGYAPTIMDALELYDKTGERGHQLKVGTKGIIVEIDEHDPHQPYNVLAETGMTQWLQASQMALKGEK